MRRVASVFLIVMLLLSLFSFPVVAVQGEWNSEECREHYGIGYSLTCELVPGFVEPPTESDHEDGFDLKSEIISQKSLQDQYSTSFNRTDDYLETYLWNVAKVEYIETLNDTDSTVDARSAAYEAVTDEGVKELRAMENLNNMLVSEMKDALAGSDYNTDDVEYVLRDEDDDQYFGPLSLSTETVEKTMQGQTFRFDRLVVTDSDGASSGNAFHYAPAVDNSERFEDTLYFQDTTQDDTFGGGKEYLHEANWVFNPTDMNDVISLTKQRIDTFDGTVESEGINASNISLSTSNWLQEYASTQSTSGVVAGLAASGHSLDTVNTTDLSVDGTNFTGFVGTSPDLSEWLANNNQSTITENETLDLNNASGDLVVVDPVTGEQRRFSSGTVEFDNFEGNRSSATFEPPSTPSPSNISAVLDSLERLQSMEQNATEFEEPQAASAGFFGDVSDRELLIGGAAVAGLLFLASRSGGGS